jgi:hypothetical protein
VVAAVALSAQEIARALLDPQAYAAEQAALEVRPDIKMRWDAPRGGAGRGGLLAAAAAWQGISRTRPAAKWWGGGVLGGVEECGRVGVAVCARHAT